MNKGCSFSNVYTRTYNAYNGVMLIEWQDNLQLHISVLLSWISQLVACFYCHSHYGWFIWWTYVFCLGSRVKIEMVLIGISMVMEVHNWLHSFAWVWMFLPLHLHVREEFLYLYSLKNVLLRLENLHMVSIFMHANNGQFCITKLRQLLNTPILGLL